MAQDEGRFGRISDVRRAWAPADIRPVSAGQIVREYLYVFAAVCPSLGKMTALILPYANTGMMNLFLAEVAAEYSDYLVIMLMDQAGWHMSKSLRVPENIRILPQPAHSPELNPVEHLWEEIREKHFYNRAFRTLDEVENTLCRAIKYIADAPERLSSMTNFPYLRNTSLNAT